MSDQYPHLPVLLNESIQAFESMNLISFVDGTLGAGGHSSAILQAHPELKEWIGIDQDKYALEIAKKRLENSTSCRKLKFIQGNFSHLKTLLDKDQKVDGILVDLGVSSMQLDLAERGFSFMREGPLDMRMNQDNPLNAAIIVNTWEERALNDIFFQYGEEKQARKAARIIVEERQHRSFNTTLELASFIEKNIKRTNWDIHPATKIFQALRIAVNGELDHLKEFLPSAVQALKKGGRLAVITFHSLEDRMVKQSFAYLASDKESTSGIGGMFLSKTPEVKILTRKPIEPSLFEIKENPRCRSAKLRIIEKL